MEDNPVRLEDGKSLENWLKECNDSWFPSFQIARGEMPYPERYNELTRALLPVHNDVEKGAMAKGAFEWMEKTKSIINDAKDSNERQRLYQQLIESDPIVYLNNHGPGHVNKVIDKVSEILHSFQRGHLTPYEGFFLLCAIQVHDIGNVFGREDHQRHCRQILDEKGKPFIRDAIERRVIEKLALVHGGAFNGERDTIGFLSESRTLHEKKVRKKLLAALLRFGDELADDSTRADRDGLEQGTILEGSLIYHRYSEALHTVKIATDGANERVQLELSYEFDSDLAAQEFKKNGENKYLLDEIYNRTLKMERERRYCMRFLRPYFSLDCIRVEIIIGHAKSPLQSDKIQYTLEENGYPSDPASGGIKNYSRSIRSGEEEMQHLRREWGL